MKRILMAIALLFFLLPQSAGAGQEFHAIREKESTNRLYERAMEFFTKKFPEVFRKRLDNSQKYIDTVLDIFREKEVPVELAYLPLIESEFSPFAVGQGDATGLWQFMRGTAIRYGLKIDGYVDERRDPVKSTYAAAEYLRDLYSRFGAWDIALAAYNAGEGKVTRLFGRSGDGRLPMGVNRYLASFLAASTVARNPERYGFKGYEDGEDDPQYREITTERATRLTAIAEKFNTSVSAIRSLNPALLKDMTPPYRYTLRLPGE